MTQPHRVAVIEVGGRAVRLLVAEASLDAQLQNVLTAWKEVDLVAAVDAGGLETELKIAEATAVINDFRIKAEELRPTRIVAFGTEAIRRLGGSYLKHFREVVPDFQVLSRREEAELSFLAGVMRAQKGYCRDVASIVVDQGSGSMEVVIGTVQPNGPKIDVYRSYKLGTRELVKILHDEGNFDRSVRLWRHAFRVIGH